MSTDLSLPLQLGSYRLLEKLGGGGMGAVYRAINTSLGVEVAVKVPHEDHRDGDSLARFKREARTGAKFMRHRHLCAVYHFEVDAASGLPYLVMPFIKGRPLSKLALPWQPKNAVALLNIVAGALADLHAEGIYHRDLKPDNIMLAEGNVPVVMDFGLAHHASAVSQKLTTIGQIMGTPDYMAPEQVNPEVGAIGPATDVYSLGAILYELLTGHVPIPYHPNEVFAWIHQLLNVNPEPPSSRRRELGDGFDAVCLQALGKKPAERFASMADLRRALKQLRPILEPPAVSVSPVVVQETPPTVPPTREVSLPAAPQLPPTFTNSFGMEFVLVGKGKFWMGSPPDEEGRFNDEEQHEVVLAEDFYLGKFAVTQGQWETIMGSNPSYFSRTGKGKDDVKTIRDEELKLFPVEFVSWDDTQEFLKKLNDREKKRDSGWLYRLPREAEWEYSCRGGPFSSGEGKKTAPFYFAKPTFVLSADLANFDGNYPYGKAPKGTYLERTCKVGSYQPNALGLYDMHGNVWEWCDDLFEGGPQRVSRGGSWRGRGQFCRAAIRYGYAPEDRSRNLGFRVARAIR